MEPKNTLDEQQTSDLTVWAITVPSFTLDMLTGQVQRLRNYAADSAADAKKLIKSWKAQGKIKFVRGYWKWQF